MLPKRALVMVWPTSPILGRVYVGASRKYVSNAITKKYSAQFCHIGIPPRGLVINMAMTSAWMTARNPSEGLNEAIAEDMEKEEGGSGAAVTSKEGRKEEVNKVTGMGKTNGAENSPRVSLPRTENKVDFQLRTDFKAKC